MKEKRKRNKYKQGHPKRNPISQRFWQEHGLSLVPDDAGACRALRTACSGLGKLHAHSDSVTQGPPCVDSLLTSATAAPLTGTEYHNRTSGKKEKLIC